MEITVITDCTGLKQDAIKGVFQSKFEKDFILIDVRKGESFPTPLTRDNFELTILKRVQSIKENADNDGYIATVQKGYYYSRNMWFFTAAVGIAYDPMFSPLILMASSVPVGTRVSNKKSQNLSLNMSDILAEEYPEWNKTSDSVYQLLTGENEKEWLQQPLRHCLRSLFSNR